LRLNRFDFSSQPTKKKKKLFEFFHPSVSHRTPHTARHSVKLFLAADSLMSLARAQQADDAVRLQHKTAPAAAASAACQKAIVVASDQVAAFAGWHVWLVGRFAGGREAIERLIHERGGQCIGHYSRELITHVLCADGALSNEKRAPWIEAARLDGCPVLSVAELYRVVDLPVPDPPIRKKHTPRSETAAATDATTTTTTTTTSTTSTTTAMTATTTAMTTTTVVAKPPRKRALKRPAPPDASSDAVRMLVAATPKGAAAPVSTTFMSPDSEAASMLSAARNKRKLI
jgi:hypothetical protein